MPSKKKNRGSPIVQLRIPPDLLAKIDKQIESCNRTRREEEYTRSSFIIAALVERFDKYARARKAAAKRKPMTADEQPAEQPVLKVDLSPPSEQELSALMAEHFLFGGLQETGQR